LILRNNWFILSWIINHLNLLSQKNAVILSYVHFLICIIKNILDIILVIVLSNFLITYRIAFHLSLFLWGSDKEVHNLFSYRGYATIRKTLVNHTTTLWSYCITDRDGGRTIPAISTTHMVCNIGLESFKYLVIMVA
jgi:hypothetical protein